MHTRISGFSQQQIISEERIKYAFTQAPLRHRRSINLIRYDPNRTIATAINTYSEQTIPDSVQGSYYQSEHLNAIVIWRFYSPEEFHHILYHEIGHYVFRNILDQPARDEWLYGVRTRELKTVSDYACKNAREDFAECYAFRMIQRPELNLCPQRNEYFSNYVFKPAT